MILVDTSALIEIFDKESEIGEKFLKYLEKEEFAIPSISLEEFLYGLFKFNKGIPEELLEIDVVPFNKEDAVLASKIEIKMEKAGLKIPRMDAMIAAMAINRKAKLMTLDPHFKSISKFFGIVVIP